MPPGKQAAAGIFSFFFPDSCGKVQDAPPNLFPVFFPPALSIGSAFMYTTPTFFFGGSFCVSHSLRVWGEEQGRPSVKTRRCITGEPSLAGRKIFRAFRIVPPLPRAVWESPWGLNFHEIRNIKHCSHLFFQVGAFVFPIPCGIEEKKRPPLCENTPVHIGRVPPRREKNLPRFPDCPAIAPGSLGKPMGLGFPCNPEHKTLLPPFLSVGTFVFPIPCWIGGNDVAAPLRKCAGV